jgi:hypothetical protein
VREHLMTVLQLDAEHRVRQRFGDGALEHNRIFLWLGQKRLLLNDVLTVWTDELIASRTGTK